MTQLEKNQLIQGLTDLLEACVDLPVGDNVEDTTIDLLRLLSASETESPTDIYQKLTTMQKTVNDKYNIINKFNDMGKIMHDYRASLDSMNTCICLYKDIIMKNVSETLRSKYRNDNITT